MKDHEKYSIMNCISKGIQKRSKVKYAPRSRIMYLETVANKETENADAQAEYLKVSIVLFSQSVSQSHFDAHNM